jgi:hypothetical protein
MAMELVCFVIIIIIIIGAVTGVNVMSPTTIIKPESTSNNSAPIS